MFRFLGLAILHFFWSAAGNAQTFESVNRIPSQIQLERLEGSFGAAPPNEIVRPIPRLALELIKDFEGWRSMPYNDAAGYCTIGYGHLIALKPCSETELGEFADGITLQAGEKLLIDDTVLARVAVQDLVSVELDNQHFGALTSFVYNVGRGNFSRSTMLRLLNFGEYDLAGREFPRWVKAGGVVLQGLVIRRDCEMFMYTGELKTVAGDSVFNRSHCTMLGAAPSGMEAIDIEVGE